MIPAVTDDLLADAVQTARMIDAGRAYYREGRVSKLEIDRELSMVSAVVLGSGGKRYVTSVIFEDEELGGFPDSQCSCPVGDGCKRVAAVLFALHDVSPLATRIPARPGLRSKLWTMRRRCFRGRSPSGSMLPCSMRLPPGFRRTRCASRSNRRARVQAGQGPERVHAGIGENARSLSAPCAGLAPVRGRPADRRP